MQSARPEQFRLDRMATPIGEALLVTDNDGWLRMLDWTDFAERMRALLRRYYGPMVLETGAAPEPMKRALQRYFDGDCTCLGEIRWRTAGTPFQQAVWRALTNIPLGQTLSYGALAARLGCPNAMRAVGAANGANPISVVVPCHRVIGTNGSLTGYGGGLDRKRWLLRHEGVALAA